MFKNNNKNTKGTLIMSLLCFYYKLWTYFTPFSSVSIVGFEQVNVSWGTAISKKIAQLTAKAYNRVLF